MKKIALIIALTILLTSLILIVIYQGNDLQNISSEKHLEHLHSRNSPDGSYTLNIYLKKGILLKKAEFTFLGEVIYNNINRAPRNIFLAANNIEVEWIDRQTIKLKTMGNEYYLNIYNDSYDFR